MDIEGAGDMAIGVDMASGADPCRGLYIRSPSSWSNVTSVPGT